MSSSTIYPLAGGCDCRYVRYQLECPPLFVHCCHCRWCQRETGASFALNAMLEADRVTLLGAEPEVVNTPSESGKGQKIARCPKCRIAVLSGWARWTNRTICHLTYTFSLRPNSPGWFCRQGHQQCSSTTIASNTGRLRVSPVVRRCWQRSPPGKPMHSNREPNLSSSGSTTRYAGCGPLISNG
jgi:hypothetical protein